MALSSSFLFFFLCINLQLIVQKIFFNKSQLINCGYFNSTFPSYVGILELFIYTKRLAVHMWASLAQKLKAQSSENSMRVKSSTDQYILLQCSPARYSFENSKRPHPLNKFQRPKAKNVAYPYLWAPAAK